MAKVIDVAAGVLVRQQPDKEPEILLAQRPEGKHMAGYWEFPGGKFEAGETAHQALARELQEEIGVCISASEKASMPLIQLVHHYPERSVRLHVRLVTEWSGELQSLDQQALAWVPQSQLQDWRLLPADGPIVRAIQLPENYAISADATGWDQATLAAQLSYWQEQRIELLQWRQPAFVGAAAPTDSEIAKAEHVVEWARSTGVQVLLNCRPGGPAEPSWAARLGFDGIHLKSEYLSAEPERLHALCQAEGLKMLAASCHSAEELLAAQSVGCDFVVLGPVQQTPSHPEANVIGWDGFQALANQAGMPVYGLGGCKPSEINLARAMGGQGIAGISAFKLR